LGSPRGTGRALWGSAIDASRIQPEEPAPHLWRRELRAKLAWALLAKALALALLWLLFFRGHSV
jgi:hypothetical protein